MRYVKRGPRKERKITSSILSPAQQREVAETIIPSLEKLHEELMRGRIKEEDLPF